MTEPIDSITNPPIAPGSPGQRKCEFCASILTANGEVLTMSDRARALRILEDKHAAEVAAHTATRAQLASLEAKIVELEAKITAAVTPPAPAGGGSQWGME